MGARPAPAWRLLVDGSFDGATNLAVDEAILERYAGADPPTAPTLRLYGWSPAALSLGRRQPAPGACDPAYLRRNGIDLVRRPTGGRAVLHEHERTYAVIGRLRQGAFPGGVLDTYRRIASSLVEALARLGVAASPVEAAAGDPADLGAEPACFEHPGIHEITVAGQKLVGSAQLRRRGAFLQHGSILLRADPSRLRGATGSTSPSATAERFIDLERAAGRPVTPREVDAAVRSGFERSFGVAFEAGLLDPVEGALAARLRCWKYDSIAWTIDGRLGERERRWGGLDAAAIGGG